MKITVEIDGKLVAIAPNAIVINGVTLETLLKRVADLETALSKLSLNLTKREQQFLSAVNKL